MLAILAAVMLAAAPQHDTVFTADGGRVLGTVIEETPQAVAVQTVDGTVRRLPRRDVVRIEYADGSVSHRPAEQAPPTAAPSAPPQGPPAGTPPPPGAPPPPPAYAPPPPPPAYYPPPYYGRPVRTPVYGPPNTGPISPLWGAFSLGGMFFGGDVQRNVGVGRIFGPQLDLGLEGGLRLNPHFGLGLYLDVGVGDPGSEVRSYCHANGLDCSAETVKFGVLLRHTFNPYAHVTPWLAVGTGYAYGHVSQSPNQYNSSDVITYSGWEMARFMAGVDVRSSQVLGVGFYAGLSFTQFTHSENAAGPIPLGGNSIHTMVQAGLRLTLFP
jgi:hypothetical protein